MRAWFLGFTVWLGFASLVDAQPIRATRDLSRDVMQTMQARQRLHADPDLAAWNIGVSVENRVATLFGPAPSAEAIFRAELCLRNMIGLAGIRNELFVSDLLAPADPPLRLLTPALNPPELAPPHLPRQPGSLFGDPDARPGLNRTPR